MERNAGQQSSTNRTARNIRLAQGYELSGIIIESKTKEELTKDLDKAIDCYFESFLEQKQKFILGETEEVKQVEKTIYHE